MQSTYPYISYTAFISCQKEVPLSKEPGNLQFSESRYHQGKQKEFMSYGYVRVSDGITFNKWKKLQTRKTLKTHMVAFQPSENLTFVAKLNACRMLHPGDGVVLSSMLSFFLRISSLPLLIRIQNFFPNHNLQPQPEVNTTGRSYHQMWASTSTHMSHSSTPCAKNNL